MRNGEDWSARTRREAEDAIGYTFSDVELLKACFTHKSYSNVHAKESHNERLEFLGDAVLGLCVSEQLFKSISDEEGELTSRRKNYVSRTALEKACKAAGLMRFLRYSGGENNVGGKTPSNLFEAVIAGIYLDGGLTQAKAFIDRFLTETRLENYKSLLQEWVQGRHGSSPTYQNEEAKGGFLCTVTALGRSGKGKGESKQAAEQVAAKQLYETFILEDKA